MYVIVIGPVSYETFEDTKGVIEFHKSKADRENNNQIKEKITKQAMLKKTRHRKLKDGATQTLVNCHS